MTQVTHHDTAPFVGRMLLATADQDEQAFFSAVQDARAAGVEDVALLVVLAQALVVHVEAGNPGWRGEVRRGLLEVSA